MHIDLARALLARRVIMAGTVLEAVQRTKGLSCLCNSEVDANFVVTGARGTSETLWFETVGMDSARYTVIPEQIVRIDGMSPARIAAAQNLSLEGRELARHRRRGRRRKSETL